ncbi:hypothetical protein PanWU01x14_154790 [Parasponia andersonii]|uniref:Retrovirus-related Pol polyprotein from transposon TNT 1-94-like beta-barrel domain-containing protein n=1 Tax=Parasponia andersonii TaxID=3476 RepID=A0A2P5CGK0_PARAD|nr:hypothetical protein PanWU01x14_154790 [Parasponia andersonii]
MGLSHIVLALVIKKIVTADGTLITVAGQGNVAINQNLVLKNVLYVPKLSANLILVHKLTKDLDCVTTFSSTLCQIEERGMGRMIDLLRKTMGSTSSRNLVGRLALRIRFHYLYSLNRLFQIKIRSGYIIFVLVILLSVL